MFRAVLFSGMLLMTTAMHLTPETWKDLTVDKTVFVRFVGPACSHCARMKGDFEKLYREYKDSEEVVVAQIDCSGEVKDFCRGLGVLDFPRIKYGHIGHLEDYTSSHDIYGLRKFVERLKAPCNPDTFEGCHEQQRAEIRRLNEMSDEEIEAFIEKVHVRTKELEDDLVLQKKLHTEKYHKMIKEHKDAIAELHREGDLAMHKIVLHHRNEL